MKSRPAATEATDPLPQRWERPLPRVPGQWKAQLPGRHLALAARGDLPGLRRLLSAEPACLNRRGPHGRTLLWEAARRGRLEAVCWLLERGAQPDLTGCYNNESLVQLTSYCAAVYYRRPAVAKVLHARSAPPDVFRAAFLGDEAAVAGALAAQPALLVAEDPHDPIYYMPLLAFAVAGGHAALLGNLARRGAVVPPYSALLLHLAARAGRLDLARQLVAAGAEARAVDGGIFGAATDLAVLRYLLEQGASATRPGKNRQTPLAYVTRRDKPRRPQVEALLREFGAEA
jgi:ankyrin repeat protein